jgi:hypothetical protein
MTRHAFELFGDGRDNAGSGDRVWQWVRFAKMRERARKYIYALAIYLYQFNVLFLLIGFDWTDSDIGLGVRSSSFLFSSSIQARAAGRQPHLRFRG